MQIVDILPPEAVRPSATAASKKRVLMAAGDLAASAYGLRTDAVVAALMERETLGPTGVGHGVALPHARLDGLDRVRGCFVRLEKPVEWEAVDRQPVDLVFCLLAPASSGVEHLKALAAVSRMMRDVDVRAKLRANADPDPLHAILTDRTAAAA
ncbi:phosphotransferase IIA-like nitrogen-regulatory protein PtsN [Hasllibacter halocynthiae]|uniref:Phosphotransferase IIA-like nitrogen-regulatory protein PtsN n=1 Tax=Hasllibacter halocynthiae TaxID=595589 RepID=A0A2T0X269_9RHOB|nr:PTS sugar transporter subunit IIA [Hasllibacter halocynthiae]PRY93007.1 phosphotransferase IIA-like nitrogen-regulatory protein PtsN [Hasllibacter halocynthiae]